MMVNLTSDDLSNDTIIEDVVNCIRLGLQVVYNGVELSKPVWKTSEKEVMSNGMQVTMKVYGPEINDDWPLDLRRAVIYKLM